MKEILKKFTEKVLSREFMVMIAATILLAYKLITSEIWLTCAMSFIGVRTLLKYKEIERAKP